MRFFFIKNEQICKGCGDPLCYNDEAVVILINIHGIKIPFVFHVECYQEWDSRMYVSRLKAWRQGSTRRPARRRKPKPKVGRPRKYRDPMLAAQLRSRIYFHRSRGNESLVVELKAKLEELKR